MAIFQDKALRCNQDLKNPSGSCTATALNIKYKIFYDLEIKFSFKAIEIEGWVGVQFRK